MAQSNQTMLAVLVVGLVIGAGAGYMLAPQGDQIQTSSSYGTGYDDGWEDGFADGKSSVDPSGSTDVEESLDGIITLVYGAIGASLIAALAAIVTLMQISRKIG